MKRCLATVLVFAVFSAVVRADVTVVQTTTMEGGMAAMAGGTTPPKLTTRIKGTKGRMDVDLPTVAASTITDLVAKQVTLLRHDRKTAEVVSEPAPAAAPAAAHGTPELAVTPTGKSQVIDGMKCDEYTFTIGVPMSEATGGQMAPEVAAMLKDFTVMMKASIWVARDVPGAAEYVAFQKAAARADLLTAAMKVTGANIPAVDRMMKAVSTVDGMPYMTVMDLTIEGGSGEMAGMMKQMGTMRVTTKVTSITADALSDDLFKVPEGYAVGK
jgi:hypothetical protein